MNVAGSSSSSNTDGLSVLVDESYFSALFDYDEIFPISDENYASELHFQEALVSSFSSAAGFFTPENHRNIRGNVSKKMETEHSADSSESFCMICMDEKPISDIFRGTNCTHSYCTDCIVRYVATKIKENAARIKCPDVECTRELEPYTCQGLIPREVFERWENALCESMILSSEKFYCPFKDCSAVMVDDGGGGTFPTHGRGGNKARVTASECPSCHRLFCAQCRVTWHAGIGCEEYRRRGKESDGEDAAVIEMAKKNMWRRCPNCRFYVEKVDGCLHIYCRCGYEFCYRCGSNWQNCHACCGV